MKKLWIWNWIGEGYNSCTAETCEEALAKAVEMGRGKTGGHKTLVVDEPTLHEGDYQELEKLDRQYASLFW